MNQQKIKNLISQLEEETKTMKNEHYLKITLNQIEGLKMILDMETANLSIEG